MRKYLILALLLAAFTGSDAFAQGWGYGGGADAWAQRHDRNQEMNDDGRNGRDGNPPVWMRGRGYNGGYYGGQGYGGGYYPRPMGGGWRGGYHHGGGGNAIIAMAMSGVFAAFAQQQTPPPRLACVRTLQPVWNPYTVQWEKPRGTGPQDAGGIPGIWYENIGYPGPAYIYLSKIGCYTVMDRGTYSWIWQQLRSGDPAQIRAAFHQIMEAARAQGIPVVEQASEPPVEYDE
ncbi:hypothetical protein HZC00_04150 [Candidatus Kaiserbacteria bacterium]|nr:hypothetical protein [Candidatus Kaiserbacteria bacterium]